MHRLTNVVGNIRRWRFFNHFLITPLTGTVPIAQCQNMSLTIADNLHFDMSRLGDKFFDKHAIIGKIISAESFNRIKGVFQLSFVITTAHADTATTGGGFKHYRITYDLSSCDRLFNIRE